MKLFIIGNINAGKTTIAKQLLSVFPAYEYLAIDDFRIKYADYTHDGELKARQHFIDAVLKCENAIIEFSGGGPIAETLIKYLKKTSVLVIYVSTPVNICLDRLKHKSFAHVPYPDYPEKIEDTIIRIDNEFNRNLITNLWKNVAISLYTLQHPYDISKIPLLHFHNLFYLIKKIENSIEGQLFSFGSLGRDELTVTSDIDLFILTNKPFDSLLCKVAEWFSPNNLSTFQNKICIRVDNILIELCIINKLADAAKYYYMSLIKNASKTVLLGDNVLINQLQNILDTYHYSIDEELKTVKEKLFFFIESLPSIIEKGDDYKYYYHNNIIIHEFIKYRAILKEQYEFLYLPKYAKSLISENEWKILLYEFSKNKEIHFIEIKKFITNEIH